MKQIQLSRGMVAHIDDDDFVNVSRFKWFAHKTPVGFYAVTHVYKGDCKQLRSTLPMHRLIMSMTFGNGMIIDHIDHNGLNNQKSNLRVCTNQQNQWNMKPKSNKSGLPTGVGRNRFGRFHSYIRIGGGAKKYLGTFDTPDQAHAAYCNAAKELRGFFAHEAVS